jgi:hypothetical protein
MIFQEYVASLLHFIKNEKKILLMKSMYSEKTIGYLMLIKTKCPLGKMKG